MDVYYEFFDELNELSDLSIPVLDSLIHAIRPLKALVSVYDQLLEENLQFPKHENHIIAVIDQFIQDYEYIKSLRNQVLEDRGK